MGSFLDRSPKAPFLTGSLNTDRGMVADMKSIPPTHKAADHIDTLSNFEIWPYTVDTGCPVSDLSAAHYHDFYVVHYVTGGRGTHVIDFEHYDIEPGSLYFVSPRQLHLWLVEEELSGFIMAFSEDFLISSNYPGDSVVELEFFNSASHSPVLKVSEAHGREVQGQLSVMQREFGERNEGYVSVLRASFHIFIVQLQRLFADEMSRIKYVKEHRLVRRFKQMVSDTFASQPNIQEYAEMLNVSVSQLNDVIKEATGRTPGQILRNEQVLAAKRLLAHSDLNVAEICYQLNFEDPSYFGRFFKRETGFSPLAFRGSMRDKYQQLAR
ncbi:MAG: AraC family transcriptional regulator [Pseudodesulfovibrio sp.]